MIGNDIVDLDLAEKESNMHRKGFLEKLLLPEESHVVRSARCPAKILWLFWSCKEAVYKIIHRHTRERKYAPLQFVCQLEHLNNTRASGTVLYQQQYFYFQSQYSATTIHTYAASKPELLQQLNVFTFYYLNSAALLTGKELITREFYKDMDGVPYIRQRYTGQLLPVSLSDHGKYLGIVYI